MEIREFEIITNKLRILKENNMITNNEFLQMKEKLIQDYKKDITINSK